MSPRRPPPQPIRILRRQGRTDMSTSLASIPTFSRRIPKGQLQAARSSSSSSSESTVDLRAVTAAQVGATPEASRPVTSRAHIALAVDVQPPTPETVDSQPQRRSAEAAAALRALKQSRRTASVYSSSSSNGTLEIATTQVGQQGSLYLRPDLSGRSNLTLDQLPRNVSLEDLVVYHAGEVGNGEETLVSSTVAAEDVDHHSEPFIQAKPSTSVPTRTSSLSRSSSLVPIAPQHIAPPLYQSRPTPPSSLPPRPSHPSPPETRSQPNETEAERFKRLYLCPWEGSSPKSSLRRGGREAAVQVREEQDPEKGLPFHIGRDVGIDKTRSRSRRRKRLALRIGLGLLVVALFVDLIALNVRVWSLRDAYYDE